MTPVYIDLHIHTSEDPNSLNKSYDIDLLDRNIKKFNGNSDYLISLTDHNTINEEVYLKALKKGINIIVGVELHIKNYEECPAYHCHIYFNLDKIDKSVLSDINSKLDILYPNKVVNKADKSIPKLERVINLFDSYDFLLLPHGGQSHCTFDTSIPAGVKFDTTMERSIYYNQFDGFTARGNTGLEKTQSYFTKLGINDFVNLVTCTDNYFPRDYPNAKAKDAQPFIPTWMLAQPTFDGLRLSLSESSRLIYSKAKPELWSENIKAVKHKKENIEIDITLTQGLNVVIGGSSSGKTLLVDSIYRKIINDFSESNYEQYEVEKLSIDNPSGVTPHYLSQNYIMSVVNEATDDKIDNIEIIKNVFPGDSEIRDKIEYNLRTLKKQLKGLIECVKTIEREDKALKKIPILSRLITTKQIEGNVFDKLQPTTKEKNIIEYKEQTHEEHTDVLDEIENTLANNPFIKHDKTLIPKLKKELLLVLNASNFSTRIKNIITSEKQKLDKELRDKNVEEQSKKQNFDKLIESIRKYSAHSKKFKNILKQISTYAIKFDSEKIESMGHKLYIENGFQLNKDIFLEVINKYLKTDSKIDRFKDITPEALFESNFKKQTSKVQDYDDFEKRVYKDFETYNKKEYKIVTNDGRKFENLSAGWKTSVVLDIILGYDKDMAPIIIDQPEDNLATNYINGGLVSAIKKIKDKKQIILVSHNATIPMLADAQNVILCNNVNNKIIIKSSPLEGKIENKNVLDHIAEITDGGKSSIKKRVKKYNLKKFTE
ncbi:MAG: PHP domain-containing protein [Bacteroidetes bacterium]|nr:PHP domain-containing protein [Bacteroidota bacterium]